MSDEGFRAAVIKALRKETYETMTKRGRGVQLQSYCLVVGISEYGTTADKARRLLEWVKNHPVPVQVQQSEMDRMDASQAWDGWVGSQTPADFMRISRQQGSKTVDEAVAAYVADLPNLFPEAKDEIPESLHRLLVEVIEDDMSKPGSHRKYEAPQ